MTGLRKYVCGNFQNEKFVKHGPELELEMSS
jgi:hypothetical protein